MKSYSYQSIFFILIYIKSAHTYPTGAPASACASMTPQHSGVASQACSTKYAIQADKMAYSSSDTVRVTVSGSTSSDTFRGVLIIARSQTGQQIIGTWTVVNSTTQNLACNGVANTAITHNSRDDKTSVQAIWTPPSGTSTDNTVIRATVVQTFDTIFVNCFSVTLMNRLNNQTSNGTTIASGNTTVTPVNPVTTSAGGSASIATTTVVQVTTTAQTNMVGAAIDWTYMNSVTTVQMKVSNLRTSQWLAMGLSLDSFMGQDHVFVCKRLADDSVAVERWYNPGGHTYPNPVGVGAAQGATFTPTSQRLDNGVAYCEFTLSNFASTRSRRQANTLSSSTTYTPLIAFGNLDSSNELTQHTSRSPLAQSVQLNQQTNILFNDDGSGESGSNLHKAHGILMIFAWILFASTGILCARFYKPSWPQKKLFGKAIWFVIHQPVMLTVVLLTIIAFIIILVHEKGKWIPKSEKLPFAHSIVGILVICFALVQPIMALFRCKPDAEYRFIFNYAHRSVGSIAFILSNVAIFIALFFDEWNFADTKVWGIMVAWVCWVFVIYIVLWALEIYFYQNRPKENADGYNLDDPAMKDYSTQLMYQAKEDRIKLVILILHILVALGISIALASVIGTA